ncbi:MAG: peroxiredoxin [Granulosicoccus sp.]|jgi:peroxiredoxin
MHNNFDIDWSTLPIPEDDGGTDHLCDSQFPSVKLASTTGVDVDLSEQPGLVVVYAYPMTGTPGVALPDGWDLMPGARGCTPQSCAFRDHAAELADLGVNAVFGLSTQSLADQVEAASRLELPFSLLSDESLRLASAMRLPTFDVDGKRLLKRFTLVVRDSIVIKVFYPVFPPDNNASIVINWLRDSA